MTPVDDEFGFRAVIALWPRTSGERGDGDDWKLRRSLFDRGLVCIGIGPLRGPQARCSLAGDAVRSLHRLDVASRGADHHLDLAQGGRFANQLFRYAYVKLYALRHGLTAAFPAWEGRQLFGLDDKSCAGLALAETDLPGLRGRRSRIVGAGRSADRYRSAGLLPGDSGVLAKTPAVAATTVSAAARASAGDRRLASTMSRRTAAERSWRSMSGAATIASFEEHAVVSAGAGRVVPRLVASPLADAARSAVVRRNGRAGDDPAGVPGIRDRFGGVWAAGRCIAGPRPRFRDPATGGLPGAFATAVFPAWPPSSRRPPKSALFRRSRRKALCLMSRGSIRLSGRDSGMPGAQPPAQQRHRRAGARRRRECSRCTG